jgi:hypothetical protein
LAGLESSRRHWARRIRGPVTRLRVPVEHAKFYIYKKKKIEELRQGIDITPLPKTLQDAVYVTRGLGLQRLWIDSLCIVQDDQNYWETESKLMESVFGSVYCIIAASCVSVSSDEFVEPRPERPCVLMQRAAEMGLTTFVRPSTISTRMWAGAS